MTAPRAPGRPPRQPSLDGALAAGGALAAVWALGGLLTQVPFPPLTLADRLARWIPGPLVTAAIERLGHAALPLLGASVVVMYLAAGALALSLARRSSQPTAWAAGSMAAAFAAGGLAAPGELSPAGALAGGVLAGAAYALLLTRLARLRNSLARAPHPGRRRAVGELAAIAAGLVGAGVAARLLLPGSAGRLLTSAGARRPRRPSFPTIRGLSPEVTSVANHYVVDVDLSDPIVDAGSWQLRVHGLVERPLTLGFDELQQRFALASEYATLTCISNPVGGPLVGNSAWQGPRLAEVLAAARPRPGAVGLAVTCADGYTAGIPLDAARHRSALVAIAQNGEALSRAHGFPCRLRVPAFYGILNPKWVTDIEVIDRPFLGYWAQQGWSRTGVVHTESRIDTPRRARAGQPTWIAGVAWAGIRGISAVEVSTDDGRTWIPARLRRPLSPWAWTQWVFRWTPLAAGGHVLTCRARDRQGRWQDPGARPPHPSGATGYHRVDIEVS